MVLAGGSRSALPCGNLAKLTAQDRGQARQFTVCGRGPGFLSDKSGGRLGAGFCRSGRTLGSM
eukprot:235074-Alexandrium_andersonii.AAC.1